MLHVRNFNQYKYQIKIVYFGNFITDRYLGARQTDTEKYGLYFYKNKIEIML